MEEKDAELLSEFKTKSKKISLVQPEDFEELLQILSDCEMVIGMRLHFLIAASLAGCKVGGIAYSDKVEGILKQLDLTFLLPQFCTSTMLQELLKKAKEASHLEEQRKKVGEVFEQI